MKVGIMDSTIIAALIAAVAIIVAAIIGKIKGRSKGTKSSSSSAEAKVFEQKAHQGERHAILKDKIALDVAAFERLQKIVDSDWIQNFDYRQLTYPQYVRKETRNRLSDYVYESEKTENEFFNKQVADVHNELVKSIHSFLVDTAQVTVPAGSDSEEYVIITKAEGQKRQIEDYDQKYDKEVAVILDRAKGMIEKYKTFVRISRQEGIFK